MNLFELDTCLQSADLFKYANELGYDSVDFMKGLTATDTGRRAYSEQDEYLWLGYGYLMECLQDEYAFKQGVTFSDDAMDWIGYFLKYWTIETKEPLERILEIAPPEVLNRNYPGFHTIDNSMAIDRFRELYQERCKKYLKEDKL